MFRRIGFSIYALLPVLFLQAGYAVAQINPPFVIQGPSTVLSGGCKLVDVNNPIGGVLDSSCVSMAYDQSQPTAAAIAQTRMLLVPRGNLVFQFPMSSLVVGPIPPTFHDETIVNMGVTVTVTGTNPGEVAQGTVGVKFNTAGSAVLQIPINIDWAASSVAFKISLSQDVVHGSCDPGPTCFSASGDFDGPDLSAINLGLPVTLTNGGFVLVETPEAAFQLPLVPTSIVYAPLGNGAKAVSSFTVTDITGTNQAFTDSNDDIQTTVTDDKTQYSWGMSLSLTDINSASGQACSAGSKCDISAGFKESSGLDDSVQTDNENTFAKTASVASQFANTVQHTVTPSIGLPPLDQMTPATQPFWQDKVLAVTNAQYAVWDYPAGPVVQPLGSARIVELPILQLDQCASSVNAIEPTSFAVQSWAPKTTYAAGAYILDPANMLQWAGTPGTSGAAAPSWNETLGGLTLNELPIIWVNRGGSSNFALYRGSTTPADPVIAQMIPLHPWFTGYAYKQGDVLLLSDSIQIVTTAGTSGTTVPAWNTTGAGTTADGGVVWTNETSHFAIYAGPVAQGQTVYQWLSSADCSQLASFDQFYVNRSQSAYPLSYRMLSSGSIDPANSATTTYTSTLQTTSTVGQTATVKETTKVSHISTSDETDTVSLDAGLRTAFVALGLSGTLSDSNDQSTSLIHTTSDSTSLQQQVTNGGIAAESVTIQDTGKEQSIPVNVMQDTIWEGIAVQDTNVHFVTAAPPTDTSPPGGTTEPAAASRVLSATTVGSGTSRLSNDLALQPDFTVQPMPEATKAHLLQLHEEAARRHSPRKIPAPQPATVRMLDSQEMLKVLKGMPAPGTAVKEAIRTLQTRTSANPAK